MVQHGGTRLEAGRDFTDRDGPTAPAVAIVNRAFARRFFGGGNPIGRTLYRLNGAARQPLVIVGLVGDTVQQYLPEVHSPALYTPLAQDAHTAFPMFSISVRSTVTRLGGWRRASRPRSLAPILTLC